MEEQRTKETMEQEAMGHLNAMKDIIDSFILVIDKKGTSTRMDIRKANALVDEIFNELEGVRDLLFEIEDTFDPDSF
jgi:hypothetical protein